MFKLFTTVGFPLSKKRNKQTNKKNLLPINVSLSLFIILSFCFHLFRILPCTEEERFWATTQWDVTVRVLHSSITSLCSALHHELSYHHIFVKMWCWNFFLIPGKNGLYLKIKLTTSKFKRIKRSYAGGLYYVYYFLSFFF